MPILDDKSFIPYRLEVLTPVFIGSGEEISPLEYVIREIGQGAYELWFIDTQAWLSANADDPKFEKALNSGDMGALRTLLNGPLPPDCVLSKIPITNAALAKDLMNKMENINNKAAISFFMRNPYTHLPYLPASSIKGALSTPLIDFLNLRRKNSGLPPLPEKPIGLYNRILKEMLGDISHNVMRSLRLADLALPPESTTIHEAIGIDLAPGHIMQKTPCETLEPESAAITPSYGNMRFFTKNGRLEFPDGLRLTFNELGKICTEFYKSRFNAELKKFYKKPHFNETGEILDPVAERVANCDGERQILLRIGHYSHIECVIVSGELPKKPKGCGISRTLADRKWPFGWVILNLCSMDEYNNGLMKIDTLIRQKIATQVAEADASRKKREEEESRARQIVEETRKREEEFAALSPQERALWELEQPNATENQASAIFSKLDEFGDLRLKAADTLMRFYQRNGKWEGKKLSPRQKGKVAALKAILNI